MVDSLNLNLGELRAFVAVAEHGSFTKASARLDVTQPTLSRYIQQLERALRTRLFVRDHRGAKLTSQGERLLTKARTVVSCADDLRRTALRHGQAGGAIRARRRQPYRSI